MKTIIDKNIVRLEVLKSIKENNRNQQLASGVNLQTRVKDNPKKFDKNKDRKNYKITF